MGEIENRVAELGLIIPDAATPVANYAPFAVHEGVAHISGQVSLTAEGLLTGALGAGLGVEDGQRAAHACGVQLLAQMRAACEGDLDRVARVLKLGVFVNSAPDFFDHPKVANGASDLMIAVFGDRGRHARAAVGVSALPLGAAVEVDGVVAIRA